MIAIFSQVFHQHLAFVENPDKTFGMLHQKLHHRLKKQNNTKFKSNPCKNTFFHRNSSLKFLQDYTWMNQGVLLISPFTFRPSSSMPPYHKVISRVIPRAPPSKITPTPKNKKTEITRPKVSRKRLSNQLKKMPKTKINKTSNRLKNVGIRCM